ncbi:MAG: succinate dehydrogenase [Planctomycetes bacterium]|nr:succinate dehydrogenase [Planctomycetota bacterium]
MTQPVETWFQKNHFLVRRLHSLAGIVPIGVFLCIHLYTNSLAFVGPEKFNEHVKQLHEIPNLLVVELIGIFLPIAFHAWYGILIAQSGRINVAQYGWLDNWRYTLQRVTGWIAIVFILLHLAHFRFAHWFGGPAYQEVVAKGTTPFDLTAAGFIMWLPMGLWMLVYAVGLTASVYHFCNGIVTFCITWGITVNDLSRKRVSIAAAALAIVLLGFGLSSLAALASGPAPKATAALLNP